MTDAERVVERLAAAVFGPWCLTWDIPSQSDSPLEQMGRAVIATWQPVPHSIAELEPMRAREHKTGRLGRIRI